MTNIVLNPYHFFTISKQIMTNTFILYCVAKIATAKMHLGHFHYVKRHNKLVVKMLIILFVQTYSIPLGVFASSLAY